MDLNFEEDGGPNNRVDGASRRHMKRETEDEHALRPCGGGDTPGCLKEREVNAEVTSGSNPFRMTLRLRSRVTDQGATKYTDQGIAEVMRIRTNLKYLERTVV